MSASAQRLTPRILHNAALTRLERPARSERKLAHKLFHRVVFVPTASALVSPARPARILFSEPLFAGVLTYRMPMQHFNAVPVSAGGHTAG